VVIYTFVLLHKNRMDRYTLDLVQRSLYTSYDFLPIIIIITLLTFGIGIGNSGMLSIGIAQIALCIIVVVFRLIIKFGFGNRKETDGTNNTFLSNGIYALFPKEVSVQYLSIWIVNMSFFFTAVIISAWNVYNRPAPSPNSGSDPVLNAEIESKFLNRQTRCIMIISVCILTALLLIGYRIFFVEGRDILGVIAIISSLALGIGGGYGWNMVVIQPNIGLSNMDIFGISQQLIAVKRADIATMCELKER
jgi:hypothetical protein